MTLKENVANNKAVKTIGERIDRTGRIVALRGKQAARAVMSGAGRAAAYTGKNKAALIAGGLVERLA